MDTPDGVWGVLTLMDEERAIVLETPEDGLIHLAWEARMFDLFCVLMVSQIETLTRSVEEGMSRVELVGAMEDLVTGRQTVHNLKGEVKDLPGIASLVMALDHLEAAIASKGLRWEQG